jgi:hypothetical protein
MRRKLTAPKSAKGAVTMIAAVGAVLFAAVPASAGQLKLNIDAAGSGCGLLGAYGNSIPMYATQCDGGALSLGFHASAVIGPGYVRRLSAPAGTHVGYLITAPPGLAINSATLSPSMILDINDGQGWSGITFWAGGRGRLASQQFASDRLNTDGPFSSGFWGIQMICGWSQCTSPGQINLNAVTLTATENQGPNLTALGSNNLWYQTGRWIWNAPGDAWPLTVVASDISGVCSVAAYVKGNTLPGPSATPNTSQWQQCPDPTWTPGQGASVDTRDYISGAGQLPLTLEASNAAGVQSSVSETLNVDNEPVGVSLTTPDDTNPSVWVNHAVTVTANASAGPSGVGGMNCSVDGATAQPYPAGGVATDGDGVHTVSCTAWNNAVDPEGNPATGSSSSTIHIDEAPPSLSFAPQDPSDPTRLLVDTSDSESGVAGGQLAMRPATGGSWIPVATQFDGQHLLARFDDAGRTGAYVFRATSCDAVGNCASSTSTLTLPVRLASTSSVSFHPINDPGEAPIVRQRVRFTSQRTTLRAHPTAMPLTRAGQWSTIRLVQARTRGTQRVAGSRHSWRRVSGGPKPPPGLARIAHVPFGRPVTIYGLLTTADQVPIAGAQMQILAAPDNGTGQFSQTAVATTDATGRWASKLPPGPSRIIEALYDGSATILPASGRARTIVPARVRLIGVSPRRVAWGGTVRIVGELAGGYLPPGGALVRLRIGAGSAGTTYGVREHVTGNGRFSVSYTFGLGDPHVKQSFWFAFASLPIGDYPYAPAASRRLTVLVGGHPHSSSSRSSSSIAAHRRQARASRWVDTTRQARSSRRAHRKHHKRHAHHTYRLHHRRVVQAKWSRKANAGPSATAVRNLRAARRRDRRERHRDPHHIR